MEIPDGSRVNFIIYAQSLIYCGGVTRCRELTYILLGSFEPLKNRDRKGILYFLSFQIRCICAFIRSRRTRISLSCARRRRLDMLCACINTSSRNPSMIIVGVLHSSCPVTDHRSPLAMQISATTITTDASTECGREHAMPMP